MYQSCYIKPRFRVRYPTAICINESSAVFPLQLMTERKTWAEDWSCPVIPSVAKCPCGGLEASMKAASPNR